MTYERFIRQIIKDNCKSNIYKETFGEQMQKEIKENDETIADIVLENKELLDYVNNEIEESIRIYILRK